MAKAREVVVVAGKGHQDWQEYWDGADMDAPTTLKVRGGWLGEESVWEGAAKRAGREALAVLLSGKPPLSHRRHPAPPRPSPRHTQSWFDDRVECRNALSKLPYLAGIKELDRGHLPWTRYPEERDVLIIEGVTDTALPSDY
jgi:hypothetical protein